MSDVGGRDPPLFWINGAGSGLPMSVAVSGQRVMCFFSLELMALEYAERHLGGEPGVHWYAVGSEDPEDLRRIADGAPRQGFGGWVLNPLAPDSDHLFSSWSELLDEVERKLEVGAAWGVAPHSSRPRRVPDEAEQEDTSEFMEQNEWREVPWDAETMAMRRLSSSAVDILEGPSTPFEKPRWVEEFEQNRRRMELSGREGAETLDGWRAQTEQKIAALLARRPWGLLHLLSLLRRLPTDTAFQGERAEEGVASRFDAFQADVAERAVLKYARWDGGGVGLDAWEPGVPGLVQERPAVDAERLAEVLALVRLGGVHLAYPERLRRAIVRGQTVVLRPDGVSDSRPGPGMRRRLNLYEERRRRFSFFGETAGAFEPSRPEGPGVPGPSAAHVVRTDYREDEGGELWRYERSRRTLQKRDKRFRLWMTGLGPAHEYLKLLGDEVVAQYGLSPELIVAALSALEEAVARFVFPLGMDETPVDTFAERIFYLDKRGYLIVRDDVMDGVVLGPWSAEAYRRAFPDIPMPADPDRFAHGFKRLAYLDSYRREDLNLEDGMPRVRRSRQDEPVPMPPPFVYPAGDHRIVDLNAVGNFLQGIVDCLMLEQEPRQRVSGSLEGRLGEFFDRGLDHPRAFEPSKKLRAQDAGQRGSRVVAELDASVRVGSVLVAIDAKSLQVSPGYRAHVHADVRNRWQKFERYVEHADGQAETLAGRPGGTNYDLLADGYTHVVTLLCSTVPEYIDSDDPNFFVKEGLPRVATPSELRDYLAGATEEELKSLPFAKRIGGA